MLDFKDIGKNIVFGASRKMSDMRGSRKFSYIYIYILCEITRTAGHLRPVSEKQFR